MNDSATTNGTALVTGQETRLTTNAMPPLSADAPLKRLQEVGVINDLFEDILIDGLKIAGDEYLTQKFAQFEEDFFALCDQGGMHIELAHKEAGDAALSWISTRALHVVQARQGNDSRAQSAILKIKRELPAVRAAVAYAMTAETDRRSRALESQAGLEGRKVLEEIIAITQAVSLPSFSENQDDVKRLAVARTKMHADVDAKYAEGMIRIQKTVQEFMDQETAMIAEKPVSEWANELALRNEAVFNSLQSITSKGVVVGYLSASTVPSHTALIDQRLETPAPQPQILAVPVVEEKPPIESSQAEAATSSVVGESKMAAEQILKPELESTIPRKNEIVYDPAITSVTMHEYIADFYLNGGYKNLKFLVETMESSGGKKGRVTFNKSNLSQVSLRVLPPEGMLPIVELILPISMSPKVVETNGKTRNVSTIIVAETQTLLVGRSQVETKLNREQPMQDVIESIMNALHKEMKEYIPSKPVNGSAGHARISTPVETPVHG